MLTNILETIEKIARDGYSIEYVIVDQVQNGYKKDIEKGLMPKVTYTVYVTRLNDSKVMHTESTNSIRECLIIGIKYVQNNVKIIE